MLFDPVLTVVLGGGDLASGVIYRLHQAGFPVVVTELPAPLFVRRAVAFGEAVYSGTITVEGVRAQLVDSPPAVPAVLAAGGVPVLIDPDGDYLTALNPVVLVDARMEKRNMGLTRTDAPFVVALGPGFVAGGDVHAVVETNRGHDLGRVIWHGHAEPDTGQPGTVKGYQATRVLRSPAAGHVQAHFAIGDRIQAGQTIATVSTQPIIAPFDGVLRGIIHPHVDVAAGLKVGDLDPRGERDLCFRISDKALAVGGGVVQAVLSASVVRQRIQTPR